MRRSALWWMCCLFFAVSSQAHSADLPGPVYKAPPLIVAPVHSWTGFYVGVHGGYGWSKYHAVDPVAGDTTDTLKGWLAGAQLGYNYQFGNFVVGVEGDYSWANIKREEDNPFGTGGTATFKNDYFITAAAKLGYAFDRFLVYGKGGAAWTRDKVDVTDGIGGFANGEFKRTGWMAGAGVEYALWNNFSVKAEYNYLQFKAITETLTTGGGLTATSPSVDLKNHLIKVGLNYKFF